MVEVNSEASYVNHHVKKIVFIFSAMRHFANELEKSGYDIIYTKLDDKKNTHSIGSEIKRICQSAKFDTVIVTKPGEYRLLEELKSLQLGIKLELREDTRFICNVEEFQKWSESMKIHRMENFYQFMRKKHSILLDSDGKPEGGKWNYDSENRKPIKKNPDVNLPPKFAPDEITNSVINLVKEKFAKNPGSIEPFWFAVTQKQAEQAFDDFLKNKMAKFGDYEDAMLSENGFLYHSVISLYLNVGFLDPRKIIQTIQKNYHDGKIPLNSAEGFIRQILGWREFVRGIYWKFMPQYYGKNYFDHTRKLPEFFWTGNTDLNCLRACISQTLGESYAHHIQRLMVIGNFSLLAGLEPKQVAEWFLSVYSDAFEWVELPNVYGLALFADGGIIASKPYVSSGNYIQKMSNYCDSCKYDIKEKSGKNACPFNYLYWNFLLENKDKLEKNPRNYVMYNVIGKMDESKIKSIKKDSKEFLKTLD